MLSRQGKASVQLLTPLFIARLTFDSQYPQNLPMRDTRVIDIAWLKYRLPVFGLELFRVELVCFRGRI